VLCDLRRKCEAERWSAPAVRDKLRIVATLGFSMLARVLPAALVLGLASVAVASDALPPVETMTCDQMLAEMTVAGQKMNSQLDPEFAKEAQAMADQAQSAGSAGSMIGGVGSAIACSIPGVSLICGIGAQMGAMSQQGASEEHMARLQAQMARLEKAMEGLDMARMQMMSERFEAQKCQVPQDATQTP
jgi:hypothetical protein